jgi:2-polyprenyl-6-methoxyphenol hydroxylase-like FAD-dependent oxidoreductase
MAGRSAARGSNTAWDVIIVGARCAGAATAMLLARGGLNVLVLDAARAGSDTLSTHALMRGGVSQLHRWGLLDEVTAAGTPPVSRTDFYYGAEPVQSVAIRPDSDAPALYAPRRTVLDSILAGAATRSGATVRHRVKVTGLLRDNNARVCGARFVDRRTGHVDSATAALVIGADGRRSTVAALVDAEISRAGVSAGAVLLSYWSGLDRHAYQWFYGPGCTAGVVPSNDGLACVWAGMPSGRFAARSDTDELYNRVLAEAAPTLDLGGSVCHGPVRAFAGAPGFFRRSSGPGWALVGDAGYFKDPITAHGMTDALRDAELLSRAVMAAPGPGLRQLDALRAYEATRDELCRPFSELTERIASYQWGLEEIRELLPALSRAMRAEVRSIQDFGATGGAASADVEDRTGNAA